MNTHDIELPPLPHGNPTYEFPDGAYDAEQLQDYARAAIEPYQRRIEELESQLEAIGAGGVSSQRITSQRMGGPVAWPTHEFAIVVDRMYEGEGPSLAMWNGENYNFTDGDCCDRDPDGSLDGYTAEWLTHHQLEQRLFSQQPAEPDYKQLFEQMCERCDALDAKLAEYSEREPVARVNDDGFIVDTGLGLAPGTLLYTAPQPAEPVNSKASNRKELLLSWVLQQCAARRYEGGAYFDNFSLCRLRYILGELDEKATQPDEPVKVPPCET